MAKDNIQSGEITPIANARITPDRHEDYLAMLDEALEAGISIFDENLEYKYMNAGMFRQLGIQPGTLKAGDTLEDCHKLMLESGLLTPEIINEHALSANEHQCREKVGRFNSIQKLADGRTMKLTRTKLNCGHSVSISRDISELVEKETMLEDAMFLGRSGYWIYDVATKETLMSQTLLKYFSKADREKIRKYGVNAVAMEDERHILPNAIKSAMAGNGRFRCRTRTLNKNNVVGLNLITGDIVTDADGKPTKIRAFVKDITEEHENALALEKAKDEAIQASKVKSEFLANMSHEIRTPMNGILGMAALLENSDITKRQKEQVGVITSSAEALLTIINDILDFSKIEAGQMVLDPVPFNLKDAISDVAALFTQTAKNENIDILLEYSPEAESNFIADPGRLRQILTNLIGNAVKFTREGHIHIKVTIRDIPERSDQKAVLIDVIDTGIGIPKDKLKNIFLKFTQADGSTTRLYGGTGLGLSISKTLVEMMNGKMSVKSELGKGSAFSFALILPVDTHAKTHAFDVEPLAEKKVLIVDDIDVNLTILQSVLSAWDMQVELASSADSAMDAITFANKINDPFDLIISDYLMPESDGIMFAEKVKALHATPVIILSSCDQPMATQDLEERGIASFQMKPFREKRLFDAIVQTLSRRKSSAPVVKSASVNSVRANVVTTKVEVLVAEDFPLNQDVIRLMLTETQYQPVFADNGQIAFDLYTQDPERFPFILMDVSMPVLDGLQTTKKITAFEETHNLRHIPIIALTGHALKGDKEKCIQAGMDDYLSKPIKQNILIEKMNGWLQKAQNTAKAI